MGSLICASSVLVECGQAYVFRVQKEHCIYLAFVVRADGVARAYLNVCPHVGLPIDGRRGEYWYVDGLHLGCVHHGAIFEPTTGLCTRGPCEGLSLIALSIEEDDGQIRLTDENYTYVSQSGQSRCAKQETW